MERAAKPEFLTAAGAALAGGVPLSEALPRRIRKVGSLPLPLALRAAAGWQAARGRPTGQTPLFPE
jgi:hypothetical protein